MTDPTPSTSRSTSSVSSTRTASSSTDLTTSADASRELAASGAEALGVESRAEDVIAWVAENFSAREVAVACSMQDSVLPALVADQLPSVDVLFLETGYHFVETIAARNEVARALDVTVVDVLPRLSVAEQDRVHGKDLFKTDPAACCRMRKMDPLGEVLTGYRLWFTGVRRDEAPTRVDTPLVTWDELHGLIKVNPLATWTFDDLVEHSQRNGLPVNPLLDNGYPSIGCKPCTLPVAPGEDPRSGRWAGSGKVECGIHTTEATA
ncbi:phosphoadenosine phosphosulfate reductase [Nesterenkonia sp. AN1]|uniref:phosphoadenylyl-sulfate reductase n=1 Tax=Nesterenkonia sp. AN1 TaxID=652017 RepID=UPI000449A3EA|nr:phosphoadenylyl-sulfate reductase [Nesterenkonia sp. AN1]EXF24073.1 phosphoadenosine phosphosulfate reductase [Nesterenkonia sp. AN1]